MGPKSGASSKERPAAQMFTMHHAASPQPTCFFSATPVVDTHMLVAVSQGCPGRPSRHKQAQSRSMRSILSPPTPSTLQSMEDEDLWINVLASPVLHSGKFCRNSEFYMIFLRDPSRIAPHLPTAVFSSSHVGFSPSLSRSPLPYFSHSLGAPRK